MPAVRWTAIALASAFAAVLLIVTVVTPLELPAQAAFGVGTVAAAIILNRLKSRRITITLCLLSVAVSTRYLYWRTTQTLEFRSITEGLFGLGLYAAEVYAWLILVLGFVQTIWPLQRGVRPIEGDVADWPTVDIFIPTYNESLQIVQDTVLAALAVDYPRDRFKVYLLDDGRRPEFKAFAEAAGAVYLTRSDNKHAKAGNLNNAMQHSDGELVCVFDADHIPTRAFLQVTVGWFQQDPKLCLLQTPHHFYSPDPAQRNLVTVKDVPEEGALFYGVVQPGNDFWNAAFFCGSCAVIRREALMETNGFAGETVTEDAHTALKMQRRGWNTAYLNVRLASGLATERLALHVGQRARWARGMMQIFRIDNPLMGPGLSLGQRLCYLNAMMHFMFPLPRIVFLTSPLAFLLFGQNIIFASAPMIAAYAGPHLIHSIATSNRVQGENRRAFWGEVYETLIAFHLVVPTLTTLFDPKRGKFNVTEKGGLLERGYFDVKLMWPHILAIFLLVAGIAVGVTKLLMPERFDVSLGTLILNTGWSIFSLLILTTALAVGRETRQLRSFVRVGAHLPVVLRFADGGRVEAETAEISMGGFSVARPAGQGWAGRELVAAELLCGSRWVTFPAKMVFGDAERLSAQFGSIPLGKRRDLVTAVMGRADAWQPFSATPSVNPLISLVDLIRASSSILFWWRVKQPRPYGDGGAAAEKATTAAILAALALGATLLVPAAGRAQEAAPPPPIPAATPLETPVGGVRTVRIALRDMGARAPVRLVGVRGEAGLPFTLRKDEVVTGARVIIQAAFSPALLEDLSQLTIGVNGEPVITAPLLRAQADGLRIEAPVEPALFLIDNTLNLRFAGHYTRGCEDPLHSSLWATVSNTRSVLELTLQRLPPQADLSLLPAPFFDPGGGALTLPFVMPAQPSDHALQAAGATASYFGMAASYRGFRFPVIYAPPMRGEAVVFATMADQVEGLAPFAVNGPTLSIVPNPNDPSSSLLLVLGRDAREMQAAALSLAAGLRGVSGPTTTLGAPTIPVRKAYEAPRWLRTDRKVRLGEIVDPRTLQTPGLPPAPVNVPFRTAPDLFLWPRQGVPVNLRFRYPMGQWINRADSRLDVSLNGRYIKSFRLDRQTNVDSLRTRLFQGFALNEQSLVLPPYLLFGQNELQFYFDLKARKTGACTGQLPSNVRSSVGPDTTIDLTGSHHFTSLPNLAFFASSGFPFTRNADLSQTAVVMSPRPTAPEIETFLALMGRFGDSTGAPATHLRVVRDGGQERLGARDVLMIGPMSLLSSYPTLAARAPVQVRDGELRLRLASLRDRAFSMFGTTIDDAARERADDVLVDASGFSGVMSFRAPAARDRVVVALLSDRLDQLPVMAYRLADPLQNAQVRGDLAIQSEAGFSSFQVGPTFWSGDMPLVYRAMWWLSRNPLVLTLLLIAAALLLAAPIHLALKARERRRLMGGGPQ